jgi:hypothetical protein
MKNTKKQRAEIAQEIESSFATNVYPGDDKLVINSQHYEADDVMQDFSGKSWKEINLELAYKHRLSFPLFTPEAFRYYLPGMLIAALQAPTGSENNPSEILEFIFYSLIPLNDDNNETKRLFDTMSGLNSQQKASIRKFIWFFIETNPHHAKLYKDKANKLWKR